MVVHFICRGNVFRSLIAEAYLKSLGLPSVQVLSSGTVADFYREGNKANLQRTLQFLETHNLTKFVPNHRAHQLDQTRLDGGDITICMNRIAYDEERQNLTFPTDTIVWEVDDVGESGHNPTTDQQHTDFREETYQQIAHKVDELVRTAHLDKS